MKTLIIGFGHAGQAYLKASLTLKLIDDLTIVDLDLDLMDKISTGIRFFTGIPEESFELAIIASPPSTHLEILKTIYPRAKLVIIEKPFAIVKNEIKEVFRIANSGKVFFSIHSIYGEEIRLARKLIESNRIGKTTAVTQLFCDCYWPNGPKNLGGPFWDSIYNALGILNTLYDDVNITHISKKQNSDNLFEFDSRVSCRQGEFTYTLTVDWTRNINLKVTETVGQFRESGMLINHSQQGVGLLSGMAFESIPFSIPRLPSHYKSVMKHCLNNSCLEKNNNLAKRITKQVFDILECVD